MDEFCKHFIEQFHNLPGDTVKQRQQNLFQLLNRNRLHLSENPKQLECISANLEATNHLEKIFRIDFLIYFKRTKELYKEVLIGDEITLSKVAKQEWFFQEAFKDVGAEEFVAGILPTVSYAVKLKILRRLSVSEKQSDDIFNALYKQYGIFLAAMFLPKCSVDKIRDTLKSNLIKLTPSQLKLLYCKDPDLIYVYFEERTKHLGDTTFMNYNPIFVYIAQKNPDMFTKLFKKYKFEVRLGNRTTKRYIDSKKNDVLDNSESYLQVLKNGPLIRKLGNELKHLFFKNTIDRYKLNWQEFLKYYPKSQQFTLLKSVYNSTYYEKFGENPDVIDVCLLEAITEPLEREKLAKLKLKTVDNEVYFKYVTSEYCLNEFNKRLPQMSTSERVTFMSRVSECCVLNEDLDGLLKLCEMVAERFKNDDKNIRYYFLSSLTYNLSLLDKFDERHWKFILDIFAKAKSANEYLYPGHNVQFKYLEFLIRNHKSITEQLTKWPDLLDLLDFVYVWKKPELCKKILIELINVGCQEADGDKEEYDCKLASVCRRFNRKYPKFAIKIFDNERLLQSVKVVLEKDHLINDTSGIEYIICQKSSSELVKEVKKLYFEHFETFEFSTSPFLWFLKHDPKLIQENLDHFMDDFPEKRYLNQKKLWLLIKKHSYLDIDKKIVEHFTALLKDNDFSRKKKLVKALSILTSADSHLDLMKSYIPTSAKVDLTDNDVKDLYEFQCKLVEFVHYTKSPEAVLSMTLQFCKGDYLKSALSALYSSIYRLPEVKVKSALEILKEDKAVSVKKHATHLGCMVLDKATACYFLKNSGMLCLKPALKYLSRNPSDSSWEMAEILLSKMEEHDLKVIKSLERISLPLEYRSKYVEVTWGIVSKYESNEIRKIIITQIHDEVVQKLSPQFVYKIIEESIFKIPEANDFVSTLLIHLNDDNKFEFISKTLSNFKKSFWTNQKTQQTERRKLHSFIKSLFKMYIKSNTSDDCFAVKFSEIFRSLFKPVEVFEEFVILAFMKCKGQAVESCAKFLVDINNDFVKIYSRSVISSLSHVVKEDVMPCLFKDEFEKIQFCYFVYKNKRSEEDYLLIIKLLPQTVPKFTEHFRLFNEIIADLEHVNDVSVQLQFNLYLKSLN